MVRCALMYGGGSSGWMLSSCAACSAGGKRTVTCGAGVLGGDGVARMPRLRFDSAAKVDELESVRCRSWLDALPSCAWLAEPCSAAPAGTVAPELRELTDVRRSCLCASDSVGDGCESTGEATLGCMLKVGDAARKLVGEDAGICAGICSDDVSGASGAGFAEPSKAP